MAAMAGEGSPRGDRGFSEKTNGPALLPTRSSLHRRALAPAMRHSLMRWVQPMVQLSFGSLLRKAPA